MRKLLNDEKSFFSLIKNCENYSKQYWNISPYSLTTTQRKGKMPRSKKSVDELILDARKAYLKEIFNEIDYTKEEKEFILCCTVFPLKINIIDQIAKTNSINCVAKAYNLEKLSLPKSLILKRVEIELALRKYRQQEKRYLDQILEEEENTRYFNYR